jgi:hypothetical protein
VTVDIVEEFIQLFVQHRVVGVIQEQVCHQIPWEVYHEIVIVVRWCVVYLYGDATHRRALFCVVVSAHMYRCPSLTCTFGVRMWEYFTDAHVYSLLPLCGGRCGRSETGSVCL